MEQKKVQETPLPHLYLISSGEEAQNKGTTLLEQLRGLPPALPCMVQIREKHLEARSLFSLAVKAKEITLPEGSLLLLNERTDIAAAAGLHGVHLPENALAPNILRALFPKLLFGCSVHSLDAARIAEENGADYLLFGPIFDTPSKRKYGSPQGLEKLGEVCHKTSLPVFAIGGITPRNAANCRAEGAYGVAALSIFRDSRGLGDTIEQFYKALYP